MNPMRSSLLAAAILTPMVINPAQAADKDLKLVATKIGAALSIDGTMEAVWQQTTPLLVEINEQPYEPNNGYGGFKRSEVEMRALYDDQHLYMVMRWADPTLSLARFPWEKQADGSWKVLKNLDSTLHENTYYEDKFAIYWNISEKGFAKKGCDKSCHMAEKGILEGVKDSSAGRHYTLGGYLDEWHWKSTRTDINFQIDDGYVDDEHETNGKWGRHPDHKAGGGYWYNQKKEYKDAPSADLPVWMSERTAAVASSNPIYHILDSEKMPFEDRFKPGDRLPNIVTAPLQGSQGDVTAKGHWESGYWTLEIKRKLVTDSAAERPYEDLQFDDLGKSYLFAVTAFDNSQIAHVYHKGSIKLTFAKP